MKNKTSFNSIMLCISIVYMSACLSQLQDRFLVYNILVKILKFSILIFYSFDFFYNIVVRKISVRKSNIFSIECFLFIYLVIGSFFASNPFHTLFNVYCLLITIFISYKSAVLYDENLVFIFFYIGFAIQLFQIIFCLFFPDIAFTNGGYGQEIRGTFYHKNNFAIFMVVLIFIAISVIKYNRNWKEKVIAVFSLMIGTFFVILARSATSLVALVVVMSVCVLGRPFINKINIMLYCSVISIIFIPFNTYVVTRFSHIIRILGRNSDFTGRILIWKRVIEVWRRRLILGYGFSSFWKDNPYLASYALGLGAHNGVLELLLNIGLVGTGFFFWIMFNTGIKLKKLKEGLLKDSATMFLVTLMIYMLQERSLGELGYQTFLLAYFVILIDKKQNS